MGHVAKFQFQIGAIKSCSLCVYVKPSHDLFQFQIGAIKSAVADSERKVDFEFQFQIGAIKRASVPDLPGCYSVFQFQIGAIKRCFSVPFA